MADNLPQQGMGNVATDEIQDGGVANGVHVQRVKPGFGIDGFFEDVSDVRGLPVLSEKASRDILGRDRQTSLKRLFSGTFQYGIQPLYWEDVKVGAGAAVNHRINDSACRLAITGVNGNSVIRQTRNYWPFLPGCSMLALMSCFLDAGKAGLTRRAGVFDDEDGVFLQQLGDELSINYRTSTSGSVVTTKVLRANWNLDKLDGTGASKITLSQTKSFALAFDFEWLTLGVVRCGVVVDGRILYFHEFRNANAFAVPFWKRVALPVRFEIFTDGTNGGDLVLYGASVFAESGEIKGQRFHTTNGTTLRSVTTRLPMIAILADPLVGEGGDIVNRAYIIPREAWLFSKDADVLFEVVWGATISGGNGYLNVNDWSVMLDFKDADTITSVPFQSEVLLDSRIVKAGSVERIDLTNFDYPMGLSENGGVLGTLPGQIVVMATSLAGATNCSAGITWEEIR